LITASALISCLGLKPLSQEGGYYAETYRSEGSIPANALAEAYGSTRSLATAIYYLVTPDSFSFMHRLSSDEVFHFYLGDPVEMLQLYPDGSGRAITLGADVMNGMHPQAPVRGGVWQGLRLAPGGSFALLGTTVSPGFDFADYEHGSREKLLAQYPAFTERIIALTRR